MPWPSPRKHILALDPYRLAARDAPGPSLIRLDQNENGAPPSPKVLAAARSALNEINRYPEGDAASLRAAIAAAEGLPAERIVCGAGSMELLGLLAQAYLGPGDEALMSQYGYLYFRSVAAAAGARIVAAPEQDLQVSVDALLARAGPDTRMVYLANPNNPTGSLLPRGELLRLRAGLRPDVLLVLDAAYAEYVGEPGYEPGAALVEDAPNTVMLRSFSKIHGLAGLRIGWAYAPPDIVDALNRIRHPNGISAPGIAAAIAAIGDRATMMEARQATARRRDRLIQGLQALGLAPLSSHTNFLLLPLADDAEARALYEEMKDKEIMLRPMAGYGLGHCLRITIGSEAEIEILLRAFGNRARRAAVAS
jgi:histidinol-phosphate aminotransferase